MGLVEAKAPGRARASGRWMARWLTGMGALAIVTVTIVAPVSGQTDEVDPESRAGVPSVTSLIRPRVLVVCTYERKADSTQNQFMEITRALSARPGSVHMSVHHLISESGVPDVMSPDYIAALAQVVRAKFPGQTFDLVVTIDTLAFQVMTGPGRDVAGNAPIVFSGVTWDPAKVRATGANATGVVERIDVRGSLDLIRTTLPKAGTVLIVEHGTGYGRRLREEISPQIDGAKGTLDVRWSTATTMEGLWREVGALPEDAAVLYLSFSGVHALMQTEPQMLERLWKRPVFGVYETEIMPALTGGRVISSVAGGREAGAMAARVLRGEPASSIPISEMGALKTVVRQPELVRWGIAESSLPAGTLVVDRPLPPRPLLDRIRDVLDWAIIVCVVQAGLIGLLVYNLRRRRRVEAALRTSEERYKLAVKGTNDGIWDWDIVRDRSYFSLRAREMLGIPPEDTAIGSESPWAERLHPEDRDRVWGVLRAHLDEDVPYDVEYRLRVGVPSDTGGSYRWFRSRGKATRDTSGKPIRMAGSLADIHERVEARNRLRESEERYRRIVETADEGIWVVDTVWRTTFANARMADLLGTTPEAMLGRHLFDFMDDQARRQCVEHMRRREGGVREQHDFRFRRADGTELWTMLSASPIMDDAGKFAGALAMVTDVTQRHRAEQAAREAERAFRSTFEHAAVGISNVSSDGTWVMMNDRLCEMLGYSRDELMARTFADVTHPEDVNLNRDLFQNALAGAGDTYSMEKRYIRKDGRVIWGMLTAALVRDEAGRPDYFISVVQDITARKSAEAELAESRRLLEQAQHVGRIGSWAWELREGGRLDWSSEVHRIFGVTPEEFDHRVEFFERRLHPADVERVHKASRAAIAGGPKYSIDHRIVRPDGEVRWVHQEAEIERDREGRPERMIGVVQDITGRAEAEQLNESQRRVLEMIATGAAMDSTINAIVEMIELQAPPAIASVLRLNELGRMQTVAAPHLPGEYNAKVDGAPIGPMAGSCGSAMFEKRRVIVMDIATDPRWTAIKDAALPHGLRACWSEPIIASDGSVLGSLAMYFHEPRGPSERDIVVITTAAHLAGIAMEKARNEEFRERSEATNRALLAANPDMMFRMDRVGRYVGFHAPDPSRLMVPPETFMGQVMEDVLPPNRAAECRKHLDALFATGMPQMYEYEVNRPGGTAGWWEVRMVLGTEGEALLLLRDVTDRVRAERRVRESEERLRLLVENTPLGVVYWGTDFRVTGWNAAAERMFGYTAEEAMGKHATFIVPEASRRYVNDVWRNLQANSGGFRGSNQNVRKDGTLLYCEWYNCPLADQGGRVIGVASVVEDVTDRRLAQQRQDFMMAELDHRVKNNLAAVISLAEQTGRGTTGYREFLDKFMGRVRAMSRMHSVLARSRWQGADLRTLVTQTLEAFGSGSAGKAHVEGESVTLGPRAAQAMAMALNELATNATKYGALSNAAGTVDVSWTVRSGAAGGREVCVRWQESGGPAVREPARRGFGSQLIEGTIAYELRGTVRTEYAASGVVCTMVVPLINEVGPEEFSNGTSLGAP